MKRKKNLLIAFFFLLFIAAGIYCDSEIYKEYIVIFKKDAVFEPPYINGKLDGPFTIYAKGKIKFKATYRNGVRDGIATKYYDNGSVENKMFYKNDKLEGLQYRYFENGKLNYSQNLHNGKFYGEQRTYDESGNLNTYSVFDIHEHDFFDYHYDQRGNLIKQEGFVFSFSIFSIDKKRDSVIVLEENAANPTNKFHGVEDLYITVATPPNLKLNLTVTINGTTYADLKVVNNTIKIPNAFPNIGTYKIFIESHLKNKQGEMIDGINERARIEKI